MPNRLLLYKARRVLIRLDHSIGKSPKLSHMKFHKKLHYSKTLIRKIVPSQKMKKKPFLFNKSSAATASKGRLVKSKRAEVESREVRT